MPANARVQQVDERNRGMGVVTSDREGDVDLVPKAAEQTADLNRRLMSGASVNVLGNLAALANPLAQLLVARLYGPSILGAFVVASATSRLGETIIGSGFRDGLVMYGARYAHQEAQADSDRLYQAMANALLIVGALSVVVAWAALALPSLVSRAFEQPEVARAVGLALLALPFASVRELIIAATRSLMIMRYQLLITGILLPLSMVLMTGIGAIVAPTLETVVWAFVGSHALSCLAAMVVFGKHFSLRRLGAAFGRLRIDTEFVGFALPQNLNVTFVQFVSSVDVVVLGLYAVQPELIAFYGIAAQILRELRTVRRSFSNILAPLIARLHHEGRLRELEGRFITTSRWSLLATLPLALVVMVMLPDLLALVHPSFSGDLGFCWLLLVEPLLAAAIGLSGHVLVMTGHARWNLLNSAIAAVTNVGIMLWLVPGYGILGAAVGTMVSCTITTSLQLFETKYLVGVGTSLQGLSKPLVAGVVAAGVSGFLMWSADGGAHFFIRVASAALGLVAFAVTLKLLGLEAEDGEALRGMRLRSRAR